MATRKRYGVVRSRACPPPASRSVGGGALGQAATGLSLALLVAWLGAGCSGTDASAATSGKARAAASAALRSGAGEAVPPVETYPIAPEATPSEPLAPGSTEPIVAGRQASAASPVAVMGAGSGDAYARQWRERPVVRKSAAFARSPRAAAAHGALPAQSGRSPAGQDGPAMLAPPAAARPAEVPGPPKAQPSEPRKRLPLVDDQPRIRIVD